MKNSSLLAQVFNLYHISKLVQVFNLCLILFLSNPKKKFTNLLTILSLLLTYDLRLTTRYSRISTTHYRLPTIIFSILLFSTQLLSQRSLATLEDDMVLVEGGSFIMGGLPGRDDKNGLTIYFYETPAHEVSLPSFYISKYEVTQQLWQQVMGNNPSNFSSCGPLCPVEAVSWYDCVEFCNKLSIIQGLSPVYTIDKNTDPENGNIYDDVKWQVRWNMNADGYRLPCEAEWEYAARGGNKSKGYQYSGSDNIDVVAWYAITSGSNTHSIATKAANELGFYDFSGNLEEWCYDFYTSYGSSIYDCKDGEGGLRIHRGGSWYGLAQYARVSGRFYEDPYGHASNIGFRLSRTVRL